MSNKKQTKKPHTILRVLVLIILIICQGSTPVCLDIFLSFLDFSSFPEGLCCLFLYYAHLQACSLRVVSHQGSARPLWSVATTLGCTGSSGLRAPRVQVLTRLLTGELEAGACKGILHKAQAVISPLGLPPRVQLWWNLTTL